jgi:hypothetical protein
LAFFNVALLVAVLLGNEVKLDEIEKTFCNRGFMGQEEAILAVQIIPKLVKVAIAAKKLNPFINSSLNDALVVDEFDAEQLRSALADLEQP